VSVNGSRGIAHPLVVYRVVTETDVAGDRAREQMDILQNQAEHLPQPARSMSRMSTPSIRMRPPDTS
jgi:hypothetical protein